MKKFLLRVCLGDAVYFSAAAFAVVWLTNFLYERLNKTTGRISISAAVMIMLSIIIVLFIVTVTDILLREHEKARIRFRERLVAVLLFMLTSIAILGLLGLLFLVPV
ncbi:hypothetical protein JXB28_05570 [Candidatus Woesearchaeota archaeon]|nr:hypothetical protein [Candidatus Woesearchaeota archaeon]